MENNNGMAMAQRTDMFVPYDERITRLEQQRNEALLRVSELTIENALLQDQVAQLERIFEQSSTEFSVNTENMMVVFEELMEAYVALLDQTEALSGQSNRGWQVLFTTADIAEEVKSKFEYYVDEDTNFVHVY